METNASPQIAELASLLRGAFQPDQMPRHRKDFQVFAFEQPQLPPDKKKSITRLCTTDMMYSAVHVVEEGGDAPPHRHAAMDQLWMVLAGNAVFTDEQGNETSLGRFNGVCVPRGAVYGYRKQGPEPLVLLQVAALDTRARRNTLKFIGTASNHEVQDGTSAKMVLFDGRRSGG